MKTETIKQKIQTLKNQGKSNQEIQIDLISNGFKKQTIKWYLSKIKKNESNN
jgi:hypothetical protein